MSVFDRSYRKYEGELKGRLFRIWSIAISSFRVQYSGKKAIILSILCNLTTLSFTLMLVFFAIFTPSSITNIFFRQFFGSLDLALFIIIMFTFNPGSIFMPLVFISALNSGAISNDRKHNSLALYMSKPIGRMEYCVGKGISVFLVSSFVTYIPWLIFMVAFTLLSGLTGNSFIQSIWVYFAALAAAIVVNLFIGSIVLFFSSMSEQAILAGILTILILFLPSVVTSAFSYVIQADWLGYFSTSSLISSAIYYIFGQPSAESIFGEGGISIVGNIFGLNLNGYVSITIMLIISVLMFLLTFRNLKKQEVN
ncbi:MAG: ABC transporter permease [Candidatus Thorarchaeota archaeon]